MRLLMKSSHNDQHLRLLRRVISQQHLLFILVADD